MRHEAVLLCNTENGLAFRCPCCGRVEARFGNALLRLETAGLDSVLDVLDTFDVEAERESPRRSFVVHAERGDAAFAFSASEVRELRLLLGVARRMVAGPRPAPTPVGVGSVRPRFAH